MPKSLLVVLALLSASVAADAQDRRGIRFWNLTANTVKQLYLSPAGKDQWGPDQCKNDRDGEVDPDVRGRQCVVRNVEIKAGAVFTIEEKQLTECTHP